MVTEALLEQMKVAHKTLPDGRPQSVMVLTALLMLTRGDFDAAYDIAAGGPQNVRSRAQDAPAEVQVWLELPAAALHETLSHILVTARDYYQVADHPFRKFPPTPAVTKPPRR